MVKSCQVSVSASFAEYIVESNALFDLRLAFSTSLAGVMPLLASILAGGLWTWSGPTATFATAGLAVITALAALSLRPRRYT